MITLDRSWPTRVEMTMARVMMLVVALTLIPACTSAPPAGVAAPNIPAPTADNPVTAVATLNPPDARPGQEVEFRVVARIAPGHYLHFNDADSPFAAAGVTLAASNRFAPAGDWKVSAPDAKGHLVGVATFTRRLRVADSAQPGTLRLTANLAFVACNPELCWPPKTLALDTILNVTRP